jgi:acetylornithine aminotransferase
MESWISETRRFVMNTYPRLPVLLTRGEGCRVFDEKGRAYIDFVGGIAVNNLGHCHPEVVAAIREQAGRLIHVSNLYHVDRQLELARLLVERSFPGKVFFCNSGSEANEAAIKLARKFARTGGQPDRYEIVTTLGAFHGRTMATISASGQPKLHAGFEPLLPGFTWVPYDDVGAVEKAINEKTVAVLVEPVQGEGGVRVPRADYLAGLRKLCDERGALLILDEVQTGFGRTGKLFAYEHAGVTPDVITLAKGLANGVSIGAMLATNRVAAAFTPGAHGSTQGGNPLACAAALATLETLLEDGYLLENCRRMGERLMNGLRAIAPRHASIVEVRGLGLLVGLALSVPARPVALACVERGLLVIPTAETVIRLVPPLIVTQDEVDQAVAIIDAALGASP